MWAAAPCWVPVVYGDGLPLIRSRTTQALEWEPAGISALGPQYPDQKLCQENHLPACWLHILRPTKSPSSFTTFSSFIHSAVCSQEEIEVVVWREGVVMARGRPGASPGLVCFITPLGGRDRWGVHVRNDHAGALWVCMCVSVTLWSLYSMCFIAHYRGDRDVEMNGKTQGCGERWPGVCVWVWVCRFVHICDIKMSTSTFKYNVVWVQLKEQFIPVPVSESKFFQKPKTLYDF